jgi:hypothetical protein
MTGGWPGAADESPEALAGGPGGGLGRSVCGGTPFAWRTGRMRVRPARKQVRRTRAGAGPDDRAVRGHSRCLRRAVPLKLLLKRFR